MTGVILFFISAPAFLLSFYWSVDGIVHRKPKKVIPIVISTVLFLVMLYIAIGMAAM